MRKFMIDRTVPGASKMSPTELRDISRKSNSVLRELGPDVVWSHSYVHGDKITCVYHTNDESLIYAHGTNGGFPVDQVTQVVAVIDPATAQD